MRNFAIILTLATITSLLGQPSSSYRVPNEKVISWALGEQNQAGRTQ